MIFDTLTYNGAERTLAAWGFAMDSCKQRRGNSKLDTWSGTIPRANITDDPVFPFEAQVTLRTGRASASGADSSFSGGVIKFQGTRVKNPLKATSRTQGVTYEFQGPWYALDATQYLQSYKGQTTNCNPGEIVLNTTAFPAITTSGLRFISAGDQIQAILQFVLDQYKALSLPAPFQYTGRDLLNGAINLDCTGNAGAPNQNTDVEANIYNLKVNANTTIDVSLFKLFLKSEIIRPMSAAQCLQKILDSSPRTNVAFDYSTTPPTLYAQNVDNLPAVSLPIFDGANHKSIDIQRRDDLVPRAVVIGYRITETLNGKQLTDYAQEKWGPNGYNSPADPSAGPRVIVQILDLQGFNKSVVSAYMDCEPLACIGGTQDTKRRWWWSKRGGESERLADSRVRFQDSNGKATTIPDAKIYYASAGVDSIGTAVAANQEFTAADYAFYTSRIVQGTQHAWMQLNDGTPVKSVKATVSSAMTYAEYDALSSKQPQQMDTDTCGNVLDRYNNSEEHLATAHLTNGLTGTYMTVSSLTPGEVFILGAGGIAQYLYNMLSVPQYEGDYVKVEANFTNGVSLLNRLNLTGGRAEWTTMNAQIQDIEEDWGRKETTVRVGVSKHLSAAQLSAFLNMWRFRRAWYNPLLRADNEQGGDGQVQMPNAAAQVNTVPGLQNKSQEGLITYATPPNGTMPGVAAGRSNLDSAIIPSILQPTPGTPMPTPTGTFTTDDIKTLTPREIVTCDDSGKTVWAIAHITGFYTKP